MQPNPTFISATCRSCRHITGSLIVLTLFLSLHIRLSAQTNNQQPVYFSISYLKVHPGKNERYMELVKKYGEKINQYFYKNGYILGWYLHEIVMPSGSAKEYDYAAVNVSTHLAELLDDTISIRNVFKKVFPGMSNKMMDTIFSQYTEARSVVKREIYTGVVELNSDAPTTRYVSLDFMKVAPGKDSAYVKMEKEVWLPIHKERMKLGIIKDWGLYEKIMPYDSRSDFDYVTGQFFDDINSLVDAKYMEAFTKAYPGQDPGKFMQNTEDNRKLVRNELWKVVDYVDKSNTK